MAENCNGATRDKVATDLKVLLQNSETKQFVLSLYQVHLLVKDNSEPWHDKYRALADAGEPNLSVSLMTA